MNCIALALPQTAVELFGDINTGYRAPEALVRSYPQTVAITLELDNEEWIVSAVMLIVGHHLSPHRHQLGLLLGKGIVLVVSIE